MVAAEDNDDRVRRPRLREPVPVRGGRRPARRRRGRDHREHRHRRPDDDPRRGQELRLQRRRLLAGDLRRGPPGADGRPTAAWRCPRASTSPPSAFAYTARYDLAIARWFAERHDDFPTLTMSAYEKVLDLSYGENPHQRAAYYAEVGSRMHVLSMVRQLGGKELSFNNVLDLNGARALVDEFELPACAIIKHNNPCGCAVGANAVEAYERAFACDPLSAYGGVVCLNRPVDAAVADGARQAVRRDRLRAEVHRGGARDPRRQAEDAHPRGQRAPPPEHRRARPQARRRRPARAGPRHRPRGPLGDAGRHRAQAHRGRVGRDAVRLEGLQARPLQRDRASRRTSPRSASAPGR